MWWHHPGTIRKAGRPLRETWTFSTCDPGTGCLVGQSCIAPVRLLLLRRKRYCGRLQLQCLVVLLICDVCRPTVWLNTSPRVSNYSHTLSRLLNLCRKTPSSLSFWCFLSQGHQSLLKRLSRIYLWFCFRKSMMVIGKEF